MTVRFLGAWNIVTNYSANDIVTYGGQSWIALQESTNVEPVEGAYWTLMAAKGDQGDVGATGATGATGAYRVLQERQVQREIQVLQEQRGQPVRRVIKVFKV